MTTQYKAVEAVGRFKKGDFVAGLNAAQIRNLLADGKIEAVKAQPIKNEVIK